MKCDPNETWYFAEVVRYRTEQDSEGCKQFWALLAGHCKMWVPWKIRKYLANKVKKSQARQIKKIGEKAILERSWHMFGICVCFLLKWADVLTVASGCCCQRYEHLCFFVENSGRLAVWWKLCNGTTHSASSSETSAQSRPVQVTKVLGFAFFIIVSMHCLPPPHQWELPAMRYKTVRYVCVRFVAWLEIRTKDIKLAISLGCGHGKRSHKDVQGMATCSWKPVLS